MTALGQIHAAVRSLGLDEDLKRALYEQVTGKSSAADMDEAERRAVVAELRRRGASKGARKGRKALSGPYAKKLQALWIAGWNLGLVRNRDDAALLAFVKRQTDIDHIRFLHHAEDAARAIEALKGWLTRDGGVDWTHDNRMAGWTQTNGYRIAAAQYHRLAVLDPEGHAHFLDLSHLLIAMGFAAASRQTDKGWIIVMNALGERVRATRDGMEA